ADPHPGNLAVTPDGRVVFYDFGIIGRVSDETRNGIFDFYVAISRNDVDNMINSFIDMGALDPEVDREIARRMFRIMLDNVRGREIDEERVEDMIDELQEDMYEFPMRVPRDLALLFRTTTVLEGIFYTLDDDYDFFPVIRDYLLRKRMGPVGRTVVNVAVTADRLISRFVSALPTRNDDD
ncbi:MAG: AarF/UbiB family protein, partial [Halobacteriales archaeon]